jgi:glyoxylase-like metal-dependent hydrolase (beta-lactamase superfamily II)
MNDDEYEVIIVKYGTRVGTRADVYLNYSLYNEPDGPIGMDYFVWILRNEHRTVLVDTGFSEAGGAKRARTPIIDPALAWAHYGIELTDEVDVIVTHAHYDHIGNLARLPNARITIAASEVEFWASPYGKKVLFHHASEDEEIDALVAAHAAGRVRTFSGELELAPGITITEVGGHTPGQSIVRVKTPDGDALLASDAVHYYEEAERDMLFTSVQDLLKMYQGFDLIKALTATGGVAHLVSGHDPDTLARFTPVTTGPLAGIAATIGSR